MYTEIARLKKYTLAIGIKQWASDNYKAAEDGLCLYMITVTLEYAVWFMLIFFVILMSFQTSNNRVLRLS